MEEKYLLAKEKIEEYNQVQLLNYYNELEESQKEELLNDILNIDFEQIEKLYNQTKIKNKIGKDIIEPINYVDKEKLTKEQKEYFSKIGEKSIKNKEYAVVTMAGGQRNKVRT